MLRRWNTTSDRPKQQEPPNYYYYAERDGDQVNLISSGVHVLDYVCCAAAAEEADEEQPRNGIITNFIEATSRKRS